MTTKQRICAYDMNECNSISNTIDEILLHSGLPETTQIIILDYLKFKIQQDIWGDQDGDC